MHIFVYEYIPMFMSYIHIWLWGGCLSPWAPTTPSGPLSPYLPACQRIYIYIYTYIYIYIYIHLYVDICMTAFGQVHLATGTNNLCWSPLISHHVLTRWFWNVNWPTNLSTYCFFLDKLTILWLIWLSKTIWLMHCVRWAPPLPAMIAPIIHSNLKRLVEKRYTLNGLFLRSRYTLNCRFSVKVYPRRYTLNCSSHLYNPLGNAHPKRSVARASDE